MTATHRKTILFLSHSAKLFGAERSLLDLVLGLDRSAFEPVVFVPRPGPLVALLEQEKIRTEIVPYKNWVGSDYFAFCPYRAAKNFAVFFRYRSLVERIKPDLLYTNTAVIPFGGLLSVWLGVPHIWHLREFVEKDIGARYYLGRNASMRFINHSAAKVICNSRALMKDVAAKISREKLTAVYNGILAQADSTRYEPKTGISGRRDYVVCMVGSIVTHKGHADALRALSLLRDENFNLRLRIVGSGPQMMERRLRKLAANLGIDDLVVWESFRSDVMEIYRESDATLVCSRHEPFGRVAVESMAAGTPVIGTAAGGLPEIIEDDQTGLLYPPGGHEILADKIRQLFRDDTLYAHISRTGQCDVFQRFTKEKYVGGIQKIIEAQLAMTGLRKKK